MVMLCDEGRGNDFSAVVGSTFEAIKEAKCVALPAPALAFAPSPILALVALVPSPSLDLQPCSPSPQPLFSAPTPGGHPLRCCPASHGLRRSRRCTHCRSTARPSRSLLRFLPLGLIGAIRSPRTLTAGGAVHRAGTVRQCLFSPPIYPGALCRHPPFIFVL